MHGNVLFIVAKIQFVYITSAFIYIYIYTSFQERFAKTYLKSTKLDQQNEDRKCGMGSSVELYPQANIPEIPLNHTIMHLHN